MVHEFSYSFENLKIDLSGVPAMLGFPDGPLPEPFDKYVEQAVAESAKLCRIRGAFVFSNHVVLDEKKSSVLVDGREFIVGRIIARELRNATSSAFFICTAGEAISRRSQELLKGDDPVLGYIFDLLGSIIVESATDNLQAEIKQIAWTEGKSITNRYSPGYCKWNVSDQHKLFSFFPPECCGIRLTDSALMHPVKSVSGIVGIGEQVQFRDYMCALCNQRDCIHRNRLNSLQ
jgi:hypothetical protein